MKPLHLEEYFHVLKLKQIPVPLTDHERLYRYRVFESDEGLLYQTSNKTLLSYFHKYYGAIISISLSKEPFPSLERTLLGIFENKTSESPMRRLLSKTLVIIIADGYESLHPSMESGLTSWKLYNRKSIADYSHSQKQWPTQRDLGFMFEGQLACVKANLPKETPGDPHSESSEFSKIIDVIFMAKNKKRKKLHSDLWLYKGFCPMFNPQYLVVRCK